MWRKGTLGCVGTADVGYQLQLCGLYHQHPHGGARFALQEPLTQAGQAQVQQGGEGQPQESDKGCARAGGSVCSALILLLQSWLHSLLEHFPECAHKQCIVVGDGLFSIDSQCWICMWWYGFTADVHRGACSALHTRTMMKSFKTSRQHRA